MFPQRFPLERLYIAESVLYFVFWGPNFAKCTLYEVKNGDIPQFPPVLWRKAGEGPGFRFCPPYTYISGNVSGNVFRNTLKYSVKSPENRDIPQGGLLLPPKRGYPLWGFRVSGNVSGNVFFNRVLPDNGYRMVTKSRKSNKTVTNTSFSPFHSLI